VGTGAQGFENSGAKALEGDGSGRTSWDLGALGEIYPESEEQRCWNHRLMNVIDQHPKKVWPETKALLRKIPTKSRRECERLRDQFVAR